MLVSFVLILLCGSEMRVPKWDVPKSLELFNSRIASRTGRPMLSLGVSSSPRPQEKACSPG